MKVKDLISELTDYSMDADIYLVIDHINGHEVALELDEICNTGFGSWQKTVGVCVAPEYKITDRDDEIDEQTN